MTKQAVSRVAYIFPLFREGVDYRLLSYGIQRYVSDAANLPPLLRTVRAVLFPNNMPAGKTTLIAPSSDAELRALRRRCASALWALIPKGVGRLYFGGGLLWGANPVLRTGKNKTEGSAELKTATVGKRDSSSGGDRDRDRDKVPSLSSSPPSDREQKEAKGKAPTIIEAAPPPTQTKQGPVRERSRSGSRSRRSAPVPRPKTGGQGPALSADPPPAPAPGLSSGGASVSREASVDVDDDDGDGDGDDDQDREILDEIERGILDVFSDAYCNKHLVYGVLELVLVRLLPELTEKGALELWEERIPIQGDA